MVDLTVRRGGLALENPILTAAGCAGFGVELAAVLPLERLGAHVVKSLAPFATAGNPAPRLAPIPGGMLNSVGLAGPGLHYWLEHVWPELERAHVPTAVSLWGRRIEDYAAGAQALAHLGDAIRYVELNLSCPNLEADRHLFAHDPVATARVVAAVCAAVDRPILVKLSANTDQLVDVATRAVEAGAAGVVAVNTLFAQWYKGGHAVLGTPRGGGLSGSAIHAVALRAVADVRAVLPEAAIIGVGGVATLSDVERFVAAGADAIQVGTALFVDPRRPVRLIDALCAAVEREGCGSWAGWVERVRREGRTS